MNSNSYSHIWMILACICACFMLSTGQGASPSSPVSPIAPAPTSNSSCHICLPGQFSGPDCSGCSPGACPLAVNCSLCPRGQATAKNGSEACTPCDGGQYAPERGMSTCLLCNATYYCPKDTRGATEMTRCLQGYYCPARGLAAPLLCLPGWYCPHVGLLQPYKCPVGRYCPSARTISPLLCPKNHYCPLMTVNPYQCQTLYSAPEGSISCSPGAGFFVLIGGIIAVVIAIVAGVFIYRSRIANQDNAMRIPSRRRNITDSSRLLPNPEVGYQGI